VIDTGLGGRHAVQDRVDGPEQFLERSGDSPAGREQPVGDRLGVKKVGLYYWNDRQSAGCPGIRIVLKLVAESARAGAGAARLCDKIG